MNLALFEHPENISYDFRDLLPTRVGEGHKQLIDFMWGNHSAASTRFFLLTGPRRASTGFKNAPV